MNFRSVLLKFKTYYWRYDSLWWTSIVLSEGLLAVIESETLNRSFTIILAVHQPYNIMYRYTCDASWPANRVRAWNLASLFTRHWWAVEQRNTCVCVSLSLYIYIYFIYEFTVLTPLDHGRVMYKCASASLQYSGQLACQ